MRKKYGLPRLVSYTGQRGETTEIGCIPTCSAHAMLGQVARRTVLEWHKGSSDSETSRRLCRPHVKVTKAV